MPAAGDDKEPLSHGPAPGNGWPIGQGLVGHVFNGRYRVDAVIGIGGMGTVYRATQIAVDRPVALKVLLPLHAARTALVARFKREARAAGRLQHPNTIRLYDFGESEDGRLYMVSELLEGETLATRLARLGALTAVAAMDVASQVLRSLAEAHYLGIVHRDIKPDNLFIVPHDGGELVKVLDFGMVKLVTGTDRLGQLTQPGIAGGTPAYMSPECAQAQPVDARSDIYSVGVIVYEMLTGRLPFTGEDAVSAMLAHIHDPVPPLTGEAIPQDLRHFVYRCLCKNPEQRYRTALEALDALESIVRSLDRAAPGPRQRGPHSVPTVVHESRPPAAPGASGTEPIAVAPARAPRPKPKTDPYARRPTPRAFARIRSQAVADAHAAMAEPAAPAPPAPTSTTTAGAAPGAPRASAGGAGKVRLRGPNVLRSSVSERPSQDGYTFWWIALLVVAAAASIVLALASR